MTSRLFPNPSTRIVDHSPDSGKMGEYGTWGLALMIMRSFEWHMSILEVHAMMNKRDKTVQALLDECMLAVRLILFA